MKRHIIIGSRDSRLAEIQARSVLTTLASIYPAFEFSLTKITTRGDQLKVAPVDRVPSYGAFVKELQEALLNGKIDLAVHSLKDLPVQSGQGLSIAAVTKRLDPRDVLISRGGRLNELAPNSLIGTGSPRRTAQLSAYRPDLKVKNIRGNIDTRLRKVANGEVEGVIVAAAAMIRLGWEDRITEYLPVEYFLPPAGQGALGIEIRAGDREVLRLVRSLHHEPTWQSVVAERAFLQAMGGGCSAAVASLATVTDNTLKLRGMATSHDRLLYASEEGSIHAPEEVAKRLAQRLLAMGAVRTVAEVKE